MKNTVNNRKRVSTKTIKNGSLKKTKAQKQPSRGILIGKGVLKNMRQIYRRTLMKFVATLLKSYLALVLYLCSNFWHWCSNFVAYFQNTSGGMLLELLGSVYIN